MTPQAIDSHEREIRGEWIVRHGKVEADENCRRIEALTAGYLNRLGSDASGWDQLYLDPHDGRYWELTYPESELHGGGPPLLKCLSKDEARAKYSHILG